MDYSQLFLSYAKTIPEYQELVSFLNPTAENRSWVIGGFIFRTLSMQLYETPIPACDFDIIVEHSHRHTHLPKHWTSGTNHFGNQKLSASKLSIDLVPLDNIHSIISRGLKPTIKNFLTGTPLTIQSLAFEIHSQKLLGDAGINALRTRTVGVHNAEEAASRAKRYGTTINDYIAEKANSLDFKPIFTTSV